MAFSHDNPTDEPTDGSAVSAELRELAEDFARLRTETFGAEGLGASGADDKLVHAAVRQIASVAAASITTLTGEDPGTPASTDPRATAADQVQYRLGSGPCVDAAAQDTLFVVPDLMRDPRWPEFGTTVHRDMGFGSMMSFRLAMEAEHVRGALNLYADEPHAFDEREIRVGLLLATYGAALVNAAAAQTKVEHLQRALESNREIGVAVGVVMSRYKVTRPQAFDLLSIASQRLNRKLAHLAAEVVEIGEFPSSATGGPHPWAR